MSYKLNKSDGSLLVDLIDGQLDTNSSDLTLIGRNYTGFGEFINENFIHMLENFANTSAPANPIKGQLWYDTSEGRLKIYNGGEFVSSGGTAFSDTTPNGAPGDLWVDSANKQLKFFDGVSATPILAGPIYSETQGKSGFEVVSILDTQNNFQTVVKTFVGNTLVGAHANAPFTPNVNNQISEFVTQSNPTGALQKGFNTVGTDYKFYGTASRSEALIDSAGIVRTGDGYVKTDGDTMFGELFIEANDGIRLGQGGDAILKIESNSLILETQNPNGNIDLKVIRPASGNQKQSALKIDAPNQKISIFPTKAVNTESVFVQGGVTIDGDLTVLGNTTQIDVQQLKVKDVSIELGIDENNNIGNDTAVNDGGIILKSSGGDKTILYNQADDAWNISEDINLAVNKSLQINGTPVLTASQLLVSDAPNLTSIGTLTEVDVNDVNISGSKIKTTANALQLQSPGAITLYASNGSSPQKITNLDDPTDPSDAVNKSYADGSTVIGISLDVTGLNAQNQGWVPLANLLEKVFPANGYQGNGPNNASNLFPLSSIPARAVGALARVQAVDYGSGGGFTIPSINLTPNKEFTQVDQTVTTMQRTIASVTAFGTETLIQTTSSHFYEIGQQVTLTDVKFTGGGPYVGGSDNIDGTYTITFAEDPAEAATGYVSFRIDLDPTDPANMTNPQFNTLDTINFTPTVARVFQSGASNKQVLEDMSNPQNVTGTINYAPTVTVVQFGIQDQGGGNLAWVFDTIIN